MRRRHTAGLKLEKCLVSPVETMIYNSGRTIVIFRVNFPWLEFLQSHEMKTRNELGSKNNT